MTIPVPHALQNPVVLIYGSVSGAHGRQVLVQNYTIEDGGIGVVALRATIRLSDGRVLEMDVHDTDLSVFLSASTPSGDATITTTVEDGIGGELNFVTVVPLRTLYSSSNTLIDRFPRVRLDEVAARKSGVIGGQVQIEPVEVAGVVGGQIVITASTEGKVGGRVSIQSFAVGVTGGQVEVSLLVQGVRQPAEMYSQVLCEDEELLLILI